MSKGLKLLISLMVAFMVISLSALYFVSSQINPKMVKKITIETIEKNLNGVKAEIKDVDYTLGSSITLNIRDILLSQKNDRSKLLELKEIEVRIPLLAILTSGGVIEVQTSDPKVYIVKKEEIINWNKAFQSKTKNTSKESSTNKLKGELQLPAFVERSKLNFKLNNLKLLLNLGPYQKSTIDVNRIIIKNLNFNKSTAFEMNTSINYQLDKEEFFHTNFQVIGEILLKDLLEKNQFNLTTSLKVTDSSVDGLKIKIPNIKGKVGIKGSMDRAQVTSRVSFGGVGSVNSKVLYSKKNISVTDLDLNLSLKNCLKLVDSSLLSLPASLSFEGVNLSVKGKFDLGLEGKRLTPALKFETDKQVSYKLSSGINLDSYLAGEYKGQSINLKVRSDVLSGQVVTDIDTSVNLFDIPEQITSFEPISVGINVFDIKLSRSYLQKTLWSKKSPTEEVAGTSAAAEVRKVLFPPTTIRINGKRIFIADQEVSMQGKLDVGGNRIKAKNFTTRYGKGKLVTSFNTVIENSEDIENQFNFDFNNVNLAGFNAFFPPYLSELRGNFVGKTFGKIHLKKKLTYGIRAKLKGTNGEMKNFNLAKVLGPILSDISLLKGKIPKTYNVSDRFDKVYVDVLASNSNNVIKRFEMQGNKKESNILASGNISMEDKLSTVKGKIYIKQAERGIKDLTGQTKIPFKLIGNGFSIIPELKYTSNKIVSMMQKQIKKSAKKRIRKEKKKVIKKIKKNIKREEKKLKKKIEDELKNKIKGIKF